jgi:hypothetical protein
MGIGALLPWVHSAYAHDAGIVKPVGSAGYSSEVQQRPLTATGLHFHQQSPLAGTAANVPALPPVRDEEAAGSNPATPTTFSQLEARFRDTGAGFLDRLTVI